MLLKSFIYASALLITPFIRAEIAQVQDAKDIQALETAQNADLIEKHGTKSRKSSKPKTCSQELAAALYTPVTPAHVYMAKIAAELKVQISPILNGISNAQYGLIQNFMRKYDVQVTINTYFDAPFTLFNTDLGIGSLTVGPYFTNSLAQSLTGFDGFNFDSDSQVYFYTFLVQSSTTATGAIITITKSARSATFAPANCK